MDEGEAAAIAFESVGRLIEVGPSIPPPPPRSVTPNAEKQCKITGDSHNRGDRPTTVSEQRRGEEEAATAAAVQLDRRRKCNMA